MGAKPTKEVEISLHIQHRSLLGSERIHITADGVLNIEKEGGSGQKRPLREEEVEELRRRVAGVKVSAHEPPPLKAAPASSLSLRCSVGGQPTLNVRYARLAAATTLELVRDPSVRQLLSFLLSLRPSEPTDGSIKIGEEGEEEEEQEEENQSTATKGLDVILNISQKTKGLSETIRITPTGLLEHQKQDSCPTRQLSAEELQQLKNLVAKAEEVTDTSGRLKTQPATDVSLQSFVGGSRVLNLHYASLTERLDVLELVDDRPVRPLLSFLLSLRFAPPEATGLTVSLNIHSRCFLLFSHSIQITEKGLLQHRRVDNNQCRPLSEEEMQQLKKLAAQMEGQVFREPHPMKAVPSISVSLSITLDGRKVDLHGASLSSCPPEKVLHESAAPLVSYLLSLQFPPDTTPDLPKE